MYSYNRELLLKHLNKILQHSINSDVLDRLTEKIVQISSNDRQALFTAFTSAPRLTGKAPVSLTDKDKQQLSEIFPGFSLSGYTCDRLARIIMLLNWPSENKENYINSIKQLFKAAEMNEQVALYGALSLLAYPEEWISQCAEGIRSNIGTVLEAIMCDNPYPAQYLAEPAWNQLVLKAFFTEKPVERIIGLDERANKTLAYILSDYAHERWAAGRPVNPQLWRPMAKFIDERIYPDIRKVIQEGTENEKKAAALACFGSNYGPAEALLDGMPDMKDAIGRNELSWKDIGL